MGKILLIAFIVTLVVISGYIFFGGKKSKKKEKKSKKEETKAPEKIVEKAIKTSKEEKEPVIKEEPKEEEKKIEMPKEDAQKGFKIIRKKSEVKINKKALKSGSRNPSVTKVFDKNGKMFEPKIEEIPEIKEDLNNTIKEIEKKEVGRFGTREINYDVVNDGVNFKMGNAEGVSNRAPILTDRTNFGSHLNETDKNNPYNISGTGVKKAIENIEDQARGVDDDTEEMVRNVKRNFLGIEDDVDPFEMFNRRREAEAKPEEKKSVKIKDIDAKTLILADAISNPKYKKNMKKQ